MSHLTNQPRKYSLISSDSHVTEPGDLWSTRVSSKMRDRAPRMQRFEQGDAWVIEGVKDPINFGWNNVAGNDAAMANPWCKFEEIRPGGYDPKARIADMDRDRVDAEILFPTPRLSQAIFANQDVDYHLEMIRAYNDWLSEFVSIAPERFCGAAMLPNYGGVDAAIAEIERVVGRPGINTVVAGAWPNGSLEITPEDDRVWEVLTDRDITLTIHVALSLSMPGAHKAKLPGAGRHFDAPSRMLQMIFGGVFDRFPTLNVFFAEVDFGWLPYTLQQIDGNYYRLDPAMKFELSEPPSKTILERFSFGYMTDPFGVQSLAHVNPRQILWSTDYPHAAADFPYSWKSIQASMSGVPIEQRELLLHGNAERLFKFG